ncbi:MAG: phosphatase PAP2 family protein [Betaproteobacteria bacterium]
MLAALFVLVPEVDLAASRLFFGENGWLLARESQWLAVPYRGLPRLGQLTVVVLAVLWLLGFFKRFSWLRARRPLTGFLLAGALIGPVLLVDVGIKDYSGRTRPVNTQEFGGQKRFTPAFVPADQCAKNCAFVSGHVAMASFLMAFGWLGRAKIRRRWLLGSIVAAGAMAAVRMIPGGHFLSDAIFAWFTVYYALWLTELIFRRLKWLPPRPGEELPADG